MKQSFTLEERLYKTEDGKVVPEGHADAATIYKGPGHKIPLEEAVELGLVDGGTPGGGRSETGKYEGGLLKDFSDEDLLDHFVDVVEEIKDRDIDEDLVEARISDELMSADEEAPAEEPEESPAAGGEASSETAAQAEDLTSLSREQLNAKAAELGIETPDKVKGGKPKVIEAIEAKRADSAGSEGD